MLRSLLGSAVIFVVPVFTVVASSAIAAPMPTKHNCTNEMTSAKLQDKIDKAAEGDVIEISGDCTATNYIIATDGLTLRGIDGATITGDGGAPAFTVAADKVTIEGWAEIDGGVAPAISILRSGSAVVRDINLISGDDGVLVGGAAHVEINNVSSIATADNGVIAYMNGAALIIGTNISGNGDAGVFAFGGGAVHLRGGNTINDNGRYGLFASGSQIQVDDVFGDNIVTGNSEFDIRCVSYSRIAIVDPIKSTTQQIRQSIGACALFAAPPNTFIFVAED